MTITSNAVTEAANRAAEYYEDEDPQVFFSDTGAAILTDQRAVEVYSYDEGIIVQMRYLHEEGWEEITDALERKIECAKCANGMHKN
jgi:hypothetical protein